LSAWLRGLFSLGPLTGGVVFTPSRKRRPSFGGANSLITAYRRIPQPLYQGMQACFFSFFRSFSLSSDTSKTRTLTDLDESHRRQHRWSWILVTVASSWALLPGQPGDKCTSSKTRLQYSLLLRASVVGPCYLAAQPISSSLVVNTVEAQCSLPLCAFVAS
jgi:hypothetical protein